MAQSFIMKFNAARRVSTPLIAVRTPDPAATMKTVLDGYSEKESLPILCWDVVRGLLGLNEAGVTESERVLGGKEAVEFSNPLEMLIQAHNLERKSILFMLNADRFLEQPGYVQAIWNLREKFKENRRTLVLLGPGFTLPSAIAQDILLLDEPLPTREELVEIVHRVYRDAKMPAPKQAVLDQATDALCGLAAFSAEQRCFMSLKKDVGLDIEELWEGKHQQIEQVTGASVWRGKESFNNICGLRNLIKFSRLIIKGQHKMGVVLFLDELEKMFSGLQGDLSGVSQKMFGMLLTWMQNVRALGILLLGPPGTGKSLLAKALGNEAGVPTIAANIARMEGSLVGESERNLEAFLKMVEAVAGGKPICVVGTCNAVDALPPELRRRFKRGTFFIDLMDREEREGAWAYYLKQFGLKKTALPNDEGWTAAEIEQCCEMAADMGLSLQEAGDFVVPVSESAKEQIDTLRRFASGRFISASYAGKYKMPGAKPMGAGKREVN